VSAVLAGRAARRDDLAALLRRVPEADAGAGAWYLVGDSSQLWEGWLDRVRSVHLAVEGAAAAPATAALRAAAPEVALLLESPGDVIPLPWGAAGRHRPLMPAVPGLPGLRHFDPYSVAFRCLARGDDPDYRTVLRYLRRGWMTLEEMDALLEDVLPRFTRETIAQDPAEFRRKYRGLCQMWRSGMTG
jgi:hypothetical protein